MGRSWQVAQVARQDERAQQGGAFFATTVTLGLIREVASAASSLHVTSKAISCFPITSFLCVAKEVIGAHSPPNL